MFALTSSQEVAPLRLTITADRDQAKPILKPFRKKDGNRVSSGFGSARIGSWEIAASHAAWARSKTFKEETKRIETATLSALGSPQVLIAAMSRPRERGSAIQEAFLHYDFERGYALEVAPTKEKVFRPELQPVLEKAQAASVSLAKLDRFQETYWRAVSDEQCRRVLELFGVAINDLLIEAQSTYRQVRFAVGAPEKAETVTQKYQVLSAAHIRQLGAAAQQAWGIELDLEPFSEALMYLQGGKTPALSRVAAGYLNAINSAHTLTAQFSEALQTFGNFPTTKEGISEIAAVTSALWRETLYTVGKDHVAEFQKLGELGQGQELATRAGAISTLLEASRNRLEEEKDRILIDRVSDGAQRLYGDAPTPQNPALTAAIQASVQVAGKRLSDYHGDLFESYRSASLQALTGRLSSIRGASPAFAALLETGSRDDYWGAVALHATDIVVTSLVADEIKKIQEEDSN